MIIIFTDGSCLTNPGNGGWAAIIKQDEKIRRISGSEKNTTNNRMELLAPINALKQINTESPVEIYTDSQYVKLGITEWINNWVKNNWQTSKKENVKNKDLWIELYNLNKSFDINWNWVKAHAGNKLNEEVDLLAKKAANSNQF
jgi:ribonuclease HI